MHAMVKHEASLNTTSGKLVDATYVLRQADTSWTEPNQGGDILPPATSATIVSGLAFSIASLVSRLWKSCMGTNQVDRT